MRMDDKCVFTTCRIGSSQHLFGLRRRTCLRFIPIKKKSWDHILQDRFLKKCNMQPLWKENTRSREQALSRFRQTWRAEISYRRLADINLNVGPVKHALCCQRKTDVCEKKLRRFAATLTHTHKTLSWYRILPKGNQRFIW